MKNTNESDKNIRSLEEHVALYLKKKNFDQINSAKSVFSKGLGLLASAVYSNTGQTSICAQVSAYYLLGRDIFSYFHNFTPLVCMKVTEFLKAKPVRIT